jgi:hypothetical protein
LQLVIQFASEDTGGSKPPPVAPYAVTPYEEVIVSVEFVLLKRW